MTFVPEHEPSKAHDGSLHTYRAVHSDLLLAELGAEWPRAQQLSSVVVRYCDGPMVRGPALLAAILWDWPQRQK